MCPPWAVNNRATLGRSWTVVSGKAVRGGGEELSAQTSMGCQENPGDEGVMSSILYLLQLTHYDEEKRGHLRR